MFLAEFGTPQLEVSEVKSMRIGIDELLDKVPRRSTTVRGDWTLMVEYCDWTVRFDGIEVADSAASLERIDSGLRLLQGQALTALAVSPSTGATSFEFDLGAQLCVQPDRSGAYGPEPMDQWTLFRDDGRCIVVRDDCTFTVHRADDPIPDGATWTPLGDR